MSHAELTVNGLFRKLAGSVFTYGTGMMLTNAVGIILLPVFLRYLSPAEYGVWALTRIIPPFIGSILSLDLSGAVLRLYYDWKKEGKEKESLFTVWMFTLLWGGIITAIFAIFGEMVFSLIFNQVKFYPLIRLTIIAEGINLTSLLALKLLRIRDEAKLYVVLNFLQVLCTLSSIIFFVAYIGSGVEGALYGVLYANASMFLVFSAVMAKNCKIGIEIKGLKEALWYSVPLVPGNIVNNVFNVLDRFFLDKVLPASQIGIYSVARTIANILMMLVSAFQLALMPFFIKVASERDDFKVVISKVFTGLFAIFTFLTYTVAVFAPEVVLVLGKDEYYESFKYVPPLSFAFMLGSFAFLPETQVLLAKKTMYSSFVYSVKFVLFALLGIVLIWQMGIDGVILTYILTNLAALFIYLRLGQKFYPLDLRIGELLFFIAIAALFWFGAMTLFPPVPLLSGTTIFLKGLLSTALLGVIVFLYVYWDNFLCSDKSAKV